MRRRENPSLAHARLRWYRETTRTYRLTADYLTPGVLRILARLDVAGLENVPATGPVILAPNHPDNLDPYLLLHLVPRMVHVAARPDGFGTGGLCAVWRRLGAFPAGAWGMRYALELLADEQVVAIFPQATISSSLARARGAVGLVALRSGAPVVPVAIEGTECVHVARSILKPAAVSVRFGEPTTFHSSTFGSQQSLAVAHEILGHVRGLLTSTSPPDIGSDDQRWPRIRRSVRLREAGLHRDLAFLIGGVMTPIPGMTVRSCNPVSEFNDVMTSPHVVRRVGGPSQR